MTTPGQIATQPVWFPPGQWTDYFTGATYQGPGTATLRVPLNRMPVFVRAGGIIPEQPGQSHVDASGSPLTLKVFSGANGRLTLYNDAGEGLGYQNGQHTETALSYRERGRRDAESTLTIGADRGHYPGQPAARGYVVDLADVAAPSRVSVDDRRLPRVRPTGGGPGWWYDGATATLHVRTAALSTDNSHTIEQSGGRPVDRAQSAAVALALDPATPTTLAGGASTTVRATVTNAGPGAIDGARVSLTAPAGWTVTPPAPQPAGTVPAGQSSTVSWTVTAPSGAPPVTAALQATVSYVNAANRSPGSVTTYQGPPANLPPVITSLVPASAAAGQQVTIHGLNFGATQADPSRDYVFFVDGPVSWGAPFDGAAFTVNSWSDTAITITVPTPSGPGGVWHVTPGSTVTVTVNTAAGPSNTVNLPIN